jgi:hypothetical protein
MLELRVDQKYFAIGALYQQADRLSRGKRGRHFRGALGARPEAIMARRIAARTVLLELTTPMNASRIDVQRGRQVQGRLAR